MRNILRTYEDNGYMVVEYENGTIVRTLISEVSEVDATIEEQILAENQYQTALLEMQMLGGL